MLKTLSIQNYALIKDIRIDLNGGLSIITGETGAGKSILLGALSLLIGQRADTSVLFDTSRKCIVEGTFAISAYGMDGFFINNELDYADETTIRREITTDGKSRAFINDTPVNISLLKMLGDKLIDIHSQHENLYLENPAFQLEILDTIANQTKTLQHYRENYQAYRKMISEFESLKEMNEKQKSDLDYLQFQYNQLHEARLKEDETEELEAEYQTLSHAEEIKLHLGFISEALSGDDNSLIVSTKECISHLQKIKDIFKQSNEYLSRFENILIELKDIYPALDRMAHTIEDNPTRLEFVKQRLDLINSLLQKHKLSTIPELVALREKLSREISSIVTADEKLAQLQKEIDIQKAALIKIAAELTGKRKLSAPGLEKRVQEILHQLGMPNAVFSADLSHTPDFTSTGTDKIRFLFSANKQSAPQEISKVASGGEMARLMLSIKAIVAQSMALPTIIFDEIDTGVSGDIADKMGNIIGNLASFTQVINITHLPQIASKGKNHYLVYKQDQQEFTYTHIKLLTSHERITEIAKMLSGEQLSDAAINNARELLKHTLA
jgi:DNA repair protein RecN (Recombination protein N)